jgi:hypothetical protein
MKYRNLLLSYPAKTKAQALVKKFTTRILCPIVGNKKDSIYSSVQFFEREIFPSLSDKMKKSNVVERVLISGIINIHNKEGIKDLCQISRMKKAISMGKSICSDSGIPNVKIVRIRGIVFFCLTATILCLHIWRRVKNILMKSHTC